MQTIHILILMSGLLSFAAGEPSSQLFGSSMVWIPNSAQKGGGRLVLVDSTYQRDLGELHGLICLNLSTGANNALGNIKPMVSSASSALCLAQFSDKHEPFIVVATLAVNLSSTNVRLLVIDPR